MTKKRFLLTEQFNGLQGVTFVKDDCADVDTYYTVDGTVDLLNSLNEENEQLKKDATTLIYANRDYRQQNQNLQKQLDYIQNSITNAIKHQKTELGQKALQEIIADYNEWMLGHKEAKE